MDPSTRVNVRSNHVHVVVTCDCAGERARDQFKLWTSRRLSERAGLTEPVAHKAGRRHWWTEGGDCLPVGDEQYLANAIEYVMKRQDVTRIPVYIPASPQPSKGEASPLLGCGCGAARRE